MIVPFGATSLLQDSAPHGEFPASFMQRRTQRVVSLTSPLCENTKVQDTVNYEHTAKFIRIETQTLVPQSDFQQNLEFSQTDRKWCPITRTFGLKSRSENFFFVRGPLSLSRIFNRLEGNDHCRRYQICFVQLNKIFTLVVGLQWAPVPHPRLPPPPPPASASPPVAPSLEAPPPPSCAASRPRALCNANQPFGSFKFFQRKIAFSAEQRKSDRRSHHRTVCGS